MRLTKTGIVAEEWPSESIDGVEQPDSAAALLGHWHAHLAGIADDYTFGDLIALLRRVEDIEVVSPVVNCDMAAFLADVDRSPHGDDHRIEFLKVCNVAWRTHYEEDSSQPDEHLHWLDEADAAEQERVDAGIATLTGERKPRKRIDATGDDPITGEPLLIRIRAPSLRGRWNAPYHLTREFIGWGKWKEPYDGYFQEHPEIDPAGYDGAFALELTPLSDLLDLPLRYDPKVQFWSGHSASDGDLLFETEMTITFGEFLHAIFWEVSFLGSPPERDEMRASLRERAERIDRREDSDDV